MTDEERVARLEEIRRGWPDDLDPGCYHATAVVSLLTELDRVTHVGEVHLKRAQEWLATATEYAAQRDAAIARAEKAEAERDEGVAGFANFVAAVRPVLEFYRDGPTGGQRAKAILNAFEDTPLSKAGREVLDERDAALAQVKELTEDRDRWRSQAIMYMAGQPATEPKP